MAEEAYLYKLPNCEACRTARLLLDKLGYRVREQIMDDPLSQLGNQLFFKGKVVAPFVVIPPDGFYILNKDATELIKVKLNLPSNT